MLTLGGSGKLDRMVSVPMPKSLPELQHAAAQNFGHSGCLRLYHHGHTLLYHPAQMTKVQDQDIIVIRKSEIHKQAAAAGTPRSLSTHQADFTKHTYKRPKPLAHLDHESTLTNGTKGVPFDSMSRYASDYVQHPYAKPEPYQPPNAIELHTESLGKTTYSQEFTWRHNARARACRDDKALRESSLSEASKGHPLKGDSSYRLDYPPRPYVHPNELAMSPQALRQSSVGPAVSVFDSTSTYNADFQRLGPGKQRSCKPKGDFRTMNEPFEGTSEYRREYDEKHEKNRSAWVQLAREAFEGQTAEEIRRLAEEAASRGELVDFELPIAAEVEF